MAFDLSKRNNVTALACAVASALALNSGVVNAQEDTTVDEKDVEKVVVTGSRVAQDSSLEAASPVLAIGAGDIKTSGQIDLGAMLRESPQLQASLPGSFSAFNGTPLGASLLNLRNLGSERTLVMENGRRHVSGIEGTGSVDVNTISTALMRNVEVLTGGASAVYGADAVTGVVNFNMRSGASFDGLEVRTQSGVSDEMDANEFFISLANGFSSDKGDLVFAVEYQETSPVFARDRDFAGSGLYTQVANTSATQTAFGIDSRFANTWVPDYRLPISSDRGVISLTGSAFFDVLDSGGAAGCATLGSAMIPACQVIGENGLRAYNPGDVYIGPFDASGGDGVPGSPDSELILPESKRILVQAIANYEINEYVNFFIDTKFVQSETKETNQVNGFNDDIPISLDNPFIPAELLSQINQLEAEGESVSLVMSRDVLDFNATSNPEAQRKTFRVVTGFDGYIPNTELEYEVFYNYGRTDADITSRQRIEDRYFAAIDAVIDPATGNAVCRSDLDSSALPPTSPFPTVNGNFGFLTFQPGDGSCVPVNLFGKDSISVEAANFIFQPGTDQNDIVQENFLAVVSGTSADLFELPAGPIAFAVGYEWRRESSEFTPNTFSALGLTFGELDSRAGPTNPSDGEYDVSEYFMEATIPLLEGMEFAERLELRAAYRSSDYDPYGTHDAWTVGSMWSPVETFSVRATYSEAVRVPNINEAFAPTFAATLGAGDDPCNQNFIGAGSEFREANCIALIGDAVADGSYDSTNFLSAFVAGTTGGNPDLDPEEAETLTVGTVWRPDGEFDGLFDGLVVTLDYYNIQIDGLIDSLTGFDIASNCVDAPTINNQFCDAVDRDASNGFITNFRSGFINLAAVETSGIDFRVDYGFDLAKVAETDGRIEFSINGTNFLKNDEVRDVSAPDEVTDVLGTFTRPEWIVNMNVDYLIGDFVIGWRGRYEGDQLLPGLENQDIENNPDFISQTHTGSAVVHDFSLSYNFKDNLEVYGGINNAFEEDPYLGTLSRPAGPRGRFYFVGVNYTM
ncbi:TonB-dependent receptor [Alteromonas sp. McT4-15]|uniref:TonB-dependent receptor domain-containing protein n=1 Tax=Alteromonas sp. McT4-15 TaxID=2881256 RepID=UPI001CF8ED75|nr:TonB-dependent receptor [Alteromonas sp. McT4-15]MCB4436735.1 TonB-dependent receptor [Alteromonas sp. McT4-15]